MKAQFTFLSGTRAGQTDIFSQPYIGIGRHPECDLRFEAEQDLDVSARHASVTLNGSLYVLRDLGSTNGTFVNGRRLTSDHVLATRDLIRFGPNGPQVQFTAISQSKPGPQPPPPRAEPPGTGVFSLPDTNPGSPALPGPGEQLPAPAGPPRRPTPVARPAGPGTTTRVRIAVVRQTRTLRRISAGLVVLLLLAIAAYLWQGADARKKLQAQRTVLLATVDSLAGQIGALSSGNAGLKGALDSARGEAQSLRQQLATAPNDAHTIADLRRRLDAAVQRQRGLSSAVTVDGQLIARQNQDAIGIVFVQHQNGKTFTGTAFGIRTDPEGGLVITNRHVVVDSASGSTAVKMGVVFNGTAQNFRADIVRIDPHVDLALLRVSVHRGIPVVQGLADSGRAPLVGEPVATLGFPLGLDLAEGSAWHDKGMASTLTLGTVSRTLPTLLQLDSYGAPGSSGSPIFDRHGNVLGVVYGGQPGTNGRIIYGVPVGFVYQLLSGD